MITGVIVDALGDAIGRVIPEIAGTIARVDIYIVEHDSAQRVSAVATQERATANARAAAQKRERAITMSQVHAKQAAAARAQQIAHELARAAAEVERKAAWMARSARRRSGTPNRIILLDQSIQTGRIEYRWTGKGKSAGKVAVIQKGNKLSAAGRYSQPKAKVMAQIAQQNGWQSVVVTGDAAFKSMVLPELLARGIAVSNPELQLQVHAWQVNTQAEAEQDLQAKAQADIERLSAQRQSAHEWQPEKYQPKHKPSKLTLQEEREQRQANLRAERDQRQAKYDADQKFEQVIAQIKQQAADKKIAVQQALNTAEVVTSSAPLVRTADVPAVVTAPASLDAEDVALFLAIEKSIATGDIKALAGQLSKADQVIRKLTDAMTLADLDAKPFDEDGASRQLSVRDAHRRRQGINAAAMARGEKHIPFAVGHSSLTSDTYDYQQEQAVRAVSLHARSDRPEGFFSRAAGREWDARKAELEITRAAWAGAVASRDRAEQAATTTDSFTLQYRLEAIRNEHATKAVAAIAKSGPINARLEQFTKERKRIERAMAKLNQDMQKAFGRGRGQGHGIKR